MNTKTSKRRNILMIVIAASAVLLLSACQRGGVNSDDAALIRQQLEDVANRLDAVEDRIQELATDTTGSEMLISQVRRELDQARTTLAEVDDKLATTEPEITDDGLGAPMDADPFDVDPFGNDAFNDDPFDGFNDGFDNDALNDDLFNNDLNDGFGQLDAPSSFQNGEINGLNDSEAPYIPGAGGGATESVPGLPADAE